MAKRQCGFQKDKKSALVALGSSYDFSAFDKSTPVKEAPAFMPGSSHVPRTIGFILTPRYHSPMDYLTFKKNLTHAGLSIREFADLLHMNKNSITNYAKHGEVPVHLGIIAQLIVALADRRIDFRKVFAGAQVRPKRSRGMPFWHPFRQKKTGSAQQAQPPKPRFWYPADLIIPDKPVPEQRAAPEAPPAKAVKITRRSRKEMEETEKRSD